MAPMAHRVIRVASVFIVNKAPINRMALEILAPLKLPGIAWFRWGLGFVGGVDS